MRDLERQARIAELKKQVAEANAAANAAVNKAAEPNTVTASPSQPVPQATSESTEAIAPVISPVAEAVPRLDVAAAESSAVGLTEGPPAAVPTAGNPDGERAAESSPAHDQQQPA